MKILLTYDISNSAKREKVASLLGEFGERVNYSVFELEIKESSLKKLLHEIDKLSDKKDSIRVYYFCKKSIQRSLELKNSSPQPFKRGSLYVS